MKTLSTTTVCCIIAALLCVEFATSDEQLHNACSGTPCKNGATCYARTDGSYLCQCAGGYQGTNCDIGGNSLTADTADGLTTEVSTTASSLEACIDKHDKCERWTGNGQCTDTQTWKYMVGNCPISCDYCDLQSLSFSLSSNYTTACAADLDKNCKNHQHLCFDEGRRRYMTVKCAYTCGYCTGCLNLHQHCDRWFQNGECTNPTNRMIMRRICPESCGLCVCQDANENCGDWAGDGECSNPTLMKYMALNCPESCGYCGVCSNSHQNCDEWFQNGDCTNPTNRTYMRRVCPESCGLCGTTAMPTTEKLTTVTPTNKRGTTAIPVTESLEMLNRATRNPNNRRVCRDTNEHCGHWARDGQCTNPSKMKYMELNCPESCGCCEITSDDQCVKHHWTYEEIDEVKQDFSQWFQSRTLPTREEVLDVLEDNKANGGHIWTIPPKKIHMKVEALIRNLSQRP